MLGSFVLRLAMSTPIKLIVGLGNPGSQYAKWVLGLNPIILRLTNIESFHFL
jgi:hypothetical protein